MDTFMEKIVAKKKEPLDFLLIAAVIIAAIFVTFFLSSLLRGFFAFIFIAAAYGVYLFIKSRNIEYEYIVTNGDLDIDMIIARGKRKRIFSSNCKEFDIIAPVKSNEYNHNVQSINKKIMAASSMQSENVYFAVLTYKGDKTVIFFEPDNRMLENFKTFIPRKVIM